MVCRGPDRDIMYDKNDFKLQLPEEQVRMPFGETEIPQRHNISAISRHDHTAATLQESLNENVAHNEFGKFNTYTVDPNCFA